MGRVYADEMCHRAPLSYEILLSLGILKWAGHNLPAFPRGCAMDGLYFLCALMKCGAIESPRSPSRNMDIRFCGKMKEQAWIPVGL